MKSLIVDLWGDVTLTVYSDASAGRSVAFRKGLGKMRHSETKYLWIQDVIKAGRIKLLKVKGTLNPADIGTKHLSISEMGEMLLSIGLRVVPREEIDKR